MAERSPREPSGRAPQGVRPVRAGRYVPPGRLGAVNDNRRPFWHRVGRASWWAFVALAAAWVIWTNF